jgi:uncharacterized protein YrrD
MGLVDRPAPFLQLCLRPEHDDTKVLEDYMTTRLVKGTPVVSRGDGETLGTIDHVYFDPQRKAVVGFTFHRGGGMFGGGSAGLVDTSDVLSFGPDAVMLSDVSVVRSELALEPRQDHLLDLEELLKRPVMTGGGRLLGHVRAINFGEASSSLSAIDVVTAGGRHMRIEADAIETIGAELIIVQDRTQSSRTGHARRQTLRVVPGSIIAKRQPQPVAPRSA